MTIKQKFRWFCIFFLVVLYSSYCMVHGFPQTLLQALYASLSVAFLGSLIVLVFMVTSLVFGLPIHQILKQLK